MDRTGLWGHGQEEAVLAKPSRPFLALQYEELQTQAGKHEDELRRSKAEISEMNRNINRLQSELEKLKGQVVMGVGGAGERSSGRSGEPVPGPRAAGLASQSAGSMAVGTLLDRAERALGGRLEARSRRLSPLSVPRAGQGRGVLLCEKSGGQESG